MAPLPSITPEEYFALEKASEAKHELLDGIPVQKSGVTPSHARLATVIGSLLHPSLPTPFQLFDSSLRIALKHDSFAHPDCTVVHGSVKTLPEQADTVANPHAIFEVLSPSTEFYSRGRKAFLYLDIPSLQSIVLISTKAVAVEALERQDDVSWTIRRYEGWDKVVPLPSVDATLPLADLYEGIPLDA